MIYAIYVSFLINYIQHRDRSWIKSIAQSLVSAKLLFGEFNRVYTIGNYSKVCIDLLI